jgi:hypothetical protein
MDYAAGIHQTGYTVGHVGISTQICELLPSNLLSDSPPPLSPFPKSKYSLCRQCVTWRGWGLLSPVRDHILQEFNTLYLTRSRTYKIAGPP